MKNGVYLLLALILCGLLSSCDGLSGRKDTDRPINLSIPPEEVQKAISHWFDTPGPSALPTDSLITDSAEIAQLRELYAPYSFKPLWVDAEGVLPQACELWESWADLRYDGLNPLRYDVFRANPTLAAIKRGETLSSEDWALFDIHMSRSLCRIANDLVLGKFWRVNLSVKDWKSENDSVFRVSDAVDRAIRSGDLRAAIDWMRPRHRTYAALRTEYRRLDSVETAGGFAALPALPDTIHSGDTLSIVQTLRSRLLWELGREKDTNFAAGGDILMLLKIYQYARSLKQTGRPDSATLRSLNTPISERKRLMAVNMERLRWLKHRWTEPHVLTVIPKMEVEYIDDGSVQFRMRSVVGRPARPTPSLDARLETVVLSPPWIVPPTILREDVLPGIARRGGAYLARKGLRAYDRRGRAVSGSAIHAGNYRQFSFGQAPGYNSSLGEVKFNMPNPWSIYMHDTPHREDFVKAYRALSSGCVRVHRPKEFAVFLLKDSSSYSFAKVDSMCSLRKTMFIPMKRPVDVHFVYLTNVLDSGGHLLYLRDLYQWDSRVKGL